MQVNWILVWAGLFAIYYPLTALMVRIFHPAHGFMPDWLFAGTNALGWTFLLRTCRDKLQYKNPVRVRVSRLGRATYQVAARNGMLAFAVGIGAQLWVARPSWPEIVGYSIAIYLSVIVSDVLFAGSGLSSP